MEGHRRKRNNNRRPLNAAGMVNLTSLIKIMEPGCRLVLDRRLNGLEREGRGRKTDAGGKTSTTPGTKKKKRVHRRGESTRIGKIKGSKDAHAEIPRYWGQRQVQRSLADLINRKKGGGMEGKRVSVEGRGKGKRYRGSPLGCKH